MPPVLCLFLLLLQRTLRPPSAPRHHHQAAISLPRVTPPPVRAERLPSFPATPLAQATWVRNTLPEGVGGEWQHRLETAENRRTEITAPELPRQPSPRRDPPDIILPGPAAPKIRLLPVRGQLMPPCVCLSVCFSLSLTHCLSLRLCLSLVLWFSGSLSLSVPACVSLCVSPHPISLSLSPYLLPLRQQSLCL